MRTRQRPWLTSCVGLVVLTALAVAFATGLACAGEGNARPENTGGPRAVLRAKRPAAAGGELLLVPR